jgi:hypothetical protein
MTIEQEPHWAKGVARFIETHQLTDVAPPSDLVDRVLGGTLYWETELAGERRLMLVRLTNAVTMRKEVLLGNILFNDFLNKSVVHAVVEAELGEILPITNDLENAYYLILTQSDLVAISHAIQDYVMAHLPDLFFGDEDAERGIHGEMERMFDFMKSDFDPFPYYAVPEFLAPQLEEQVRHILSKLLESGFFTEDRRRKRKRVTLTFRTAQATMAAFYGRTSGGEGDAQSHPMFMSRLASDAYRVFTVAEIRQAFHIEEDDLRAILDGKIEDKKRRFRLRDMAKYAAELGVEEEERDLPSWFVARTMDELIKSEFIEGVASIIVLKEAIQSAIDAAQFDEKAVRKLFRKAVNTFGDDIESSDDLLATSPLESWFLPFIRHKGKLLTASPNDYQAMLFNRVMFGPFLWGLGNTNPALPSCRVCGDQGAVVVEINILMGTNINKFFNRLPNYKNERRHICARCALYSYLGTKVFGSTSVGRFPVPHRSNLVFHYGHHSAAESKRIGEQINVIRDVLRQVNDARIAVSQANKRVKQEEKKQRFGHAEEEDVAMAALNEKLENGTITTEEMQQLEALMERMVYRHTQAREVFETIGSAHVVDVGIGEQRLIVFALQNLYDKKRGLAQKRFARNRVTVFTLLALLQDVCGCDGPYYFRSLPCIDVEHSAPGVFYIGHHEFESAKYQRQYETLSLFARHAIPGYGLDAFKRRLKLAEDLSERPLETFSAVLRDSPIRPNEKSDKYRRFTGERLGERSRDQARFDKDLGVFDSWAYLEVFQTLRELEEVMEREQR